MPILPLSERYRDYLVQRLALLVTSDPLYFVQRIFDKYPEHTCRITTVQGQGRPLANFYRDLIRYCELSAWAERPPLIAALLSAFGQLEEFQGVIAQIQQEGPFQCHPPGQPFYVCRVAAELPLLGRNVTRAAAVAFDCEVQKDGREGRRVLLVRGPAQSGKSYTLSFFRYLSAIQPLKAGVVDFDFGDQELTTQAANADIPIELFIAQRLEAQVRRRRIEAQDAGEDANGLPDLNQPVSHTFPKLSEFQNNRNRWAKELANEFVDKVLFRLLRIPNWWLTVFDNCEKAPAEAQEFVRRLVERAAGVDQRTAKEADEGVFRVALLGDSTALIPNPVYTNHIVLDDLSIQSLGQYQVKEYFKGFALCRGIGLDVTQIDSLTSQSLVRASEIEAVGASENPPVSPQAALARAVLEKTLSLEAVAARKRSGE